MPHFESFPAQHRTLSIKAFIDFKRILASMGKTLAYAHLPLTEQFRLWRENKRKEMDKQTAPWLARKNHR